MHIAPSSLSVQAKQTGAKELLTYCFPFPHIPTKSFTFPFPVPTHSRDNTFPFPFIFAFFVACTWLEWWALIGRLPIAAMFSFCCVDVVDNLLYTINIVCLLIYFLNLFKLFKWKFCVPMEWSTESIEKVICFVEERAFLFDLSSAELARNLHVRKFPAQVSWLCVTTITPRWYHRCDDDWPTHQTPDDVDYDEEDGQRQQADGLPSSRSRHRQLGVVHSAGDTQPGTDGREWSQ